MLLEVGKTYEDTCGNIVHIYEKRYGAFNKAYFYGDHPEKRDYSTEEYLELEECDQQSYKFYPDGKCYGDQDYNLIKLVEDQKKFQPNSNEESYNMNSLTNIFSEVAKEGVKDGSSLAVSKKLTALVKKKLGKNYPAFFKTPMGQSIEQILIPMLLVSLCEVAPQIPQCEKLKTAGHHALRAAISVNMQTIIEDIMPMIDQLSKLVNEEEG